MASAAVRSAAVKELSLEGRIGATVASALGICSEFSLPGKVLAALASA